MGDVYDYYIESEEFRELAETYAAISGALLGEIVGAMQALADSMREVVGTWMDTMQEIMSKSKSDDPEELYDCKMESLPRPPLKLTSRYNNSLPKCGLKIKKYQEMTRK